MVIEYYVQTISFIHLLSTRTSWAYGPLVIAPAGGPLGPLPSGGIFLKLGLFFFFYKNPLASAQT